ncbi:hypothetical protein [Flavobacterium caeni]|uniref:Methyltransferase domain-containing protein n=1 Tax=Flavobacterium caeni TaxID=490189 RepID=A0A1G5K855_9FLAO|nr:hypothetical protein [Flavobacterium caeni]SCY96198.1 hypothetical protein SAMN02927903_03109 [Flavobacterium caeni]
MKAYTEQQKQAARNEALAYAIKTLTTNRHDATVARRSYVRDIKAYLIKKGNSIDRAYAEELYSAEISHWESFYDAIVGEKKPSDLRVAYLSGPNPENDIEVLVENGILPENIWAFESDNQMYNQAVISALDSRFPFVKIYKGKIQNYLKILPFKFDIIYLDFCKTIASEQTLSVVRDVFQYQKLSSPGTLITNFAFPDDTENNKEYRDDLNLLAANYLYPKVFTETYEDMGGGFIESPECCGISQEDFIEMVKDDSSTFYSQFITRVLYDLPGVLIPYQRLASNPELVKLFFKNFDKKSFDENYAEDLLCFPGDNAMIWSLSNFIVEKESFPKMQMKFNKQLALNSDAAKLLEQVELVHFFISEGFDDDMLSDSMAKIRKNWNITKPYLFCDVFLFHQLKDILVGQLTAPYFYNVDYTKRWCYKAKDTEMFMDLITYDECRYVFDWMPTVDMLENGVNDINRQLSLRFAMDSITKQRRWYNEEFFSGTAVVDQGAKTFEAKELDKRIRIV